MLLIKWLQDRLGNKYYPRAHADGTFLSNGQSVTNKFAELESKDSALTTALDGKLSSDVSNYETTASLQVDDWMYIKRSDGKWYKTLASKGSDTPVYFLGVFATVEALNAAYPIGDAGQRAVVDTVGADAVQYIWDSTDNKWVMSGQGEGVTFTEYTLYVQATAIELVAINTKLTALAAQITGVDTELGIVRNAEGIITNSDFRTLKANSEEEFQRSDALEQALGVEYTVDGDGNITDIEVEAVNEINVEVQYVKDNYVLKSDYDALVARVYLLENPPMEVPEEYRELVSHYQAIIDESNSCRGTISYNWFTLNAGDSGFDKDTTDWGFLEYLDTSSVTDMSYMFFDCTSLTSAPLLDTSNVTNMTLMFAYCTKLTNIPLLDTSSVTNMTSMFAGCTSLTSVKIQDTRVPTAGFTSFLNVPTTCIIYVPTSLVSSFQSADYWKNFSIVGY